MELLDKCELFDKLYNRQIVLGGDCNIHFEGDSAFRIDVVNFLAGAD